MYLKYLKYQWRTLLVGGLFSIFFGLGSFVITWLFISIIYFLEYNKAVKELESEKRFQKLIKTIKETSNKNDINKNTKHNIWGET